MKQGLPWPPLQLSERWDESDHKKKHFQKTHNYGRFFPHEIKVFNIHILWIDPTKKSNQSKHNLTNPLNYKPIDGNRKHKLD